MKKVLFLADVHSYEGTEKRQPTNDLLYGGAEVLKWTFASIPHATLLGPVLIGTILKKNGYDVEILESAFHPLQRENLHAALAAAPHFVFITTTFIEEIEVLQNFTKKIRIACPGARIILGGPSLAENAKIRELGDYSVLGEGEEVVIPLLKCIEEGREPTDIPGICYRVGSRLISNPPKLIANLDSVTKPDWSLVRRNPGEFFPLFTQRGCYWRCAFCTYPANEGYKLRYRSVESLIEEIRWNFEKFGIQRYIFSDSTFTHPEDRCANFLSALISLPFRIEWVAYARLDTLSSKLVALIKESGCKGLFFGSDSGDQDILNKMNKRLTPDQIRYGAKLMKEAGIPFTTSWIFGFPGETRTSARNTLELILELKSPLNIVHTFTLYEQSPVGLRKEKFETSGQSLQWQHATMTSSQAKRWTRYAVLKMISKGLRLGGVFEFPWFSTVGYNAEQSMNLIDDSIRYSSNKIRLKQRKSDGPHMSVLLGRFEEIRRKGVNHPVFQKRNWFTESTQKERLLNQAMQPLALDNKKFVPRH